MDCSIILQKVYMNCCFFLKEPNRKSLNKSISQNITFPSSHQIGKFPSTLDPRLTNKMRVEPMLQWFVSRGSSVHESITLTEHPQPAKKKKTKSRCLSIAREPTRDDDPFEFTHARGQSFRTRNALAYNRTRGARTANSPPTCAQQYARRALG